MSDSSQKPSVFISYAHDDTSRIIDVMKQLSSLGLLQKTELKTEEIFHDSDLALKKSLRKTVRNAMESASTVVILWSKAASESQSVNYEAGMAEALGKRMIIVLPKGESTKIPDNLANAEVVELGDGEPPLSSSIGRSIGGTPLFISHSSKDRADA